MKVVSVLISKYRFKYWLSDFHENHSLLQTFLGKMLQTTEDSVFKLRVALIGKLTGPFTNSCPDQQNSSAPSGDEDH